MALYGGMNNAFQRAMNQGGGISTAPSQGSIATATAPEPSKFMTSVQNGTAPISALGQGNPVAGAIGAAMGPNESAGAALGYEHGKGADNPWEAFIAGGVGANEDGMFSIFSKDGPKASLLAPQDPVTNFAAGGLAGIAGFLF